MRVLVTGADGFVGTRVTRVFRERGHDVFELCGATTASTANRRSGDLRVQRVAHESVAWAEPDHVLHLAGASSVARSHEDPGEAFAVNTVGTVHLLDAVRRTAPSARVVLVSTGEVYGNVDHAASEHDAPRPTSPYAASKLAAEIAAHQFGASYAMRIVVARPFNHLGAGQAPHFVVPSFARQIQAIHAAGNGELRVGNLDAVRDFSHVLDVVDAYEILLTRGVAGDTYNVASGVGRSIRSLLDELIALANVAVEPIVDPERLRPIELPTLIGDASKLRALGWTPKRSVADAISDALHEASSRH